MIIKHQNYVIKQEPEQNTRIQDALLVAHSNIFSRATMLTISYGKKCDSEALESTNYSNYLPDCKGQKVDTPRVTVSFTNI